MKPQPAGVVIGGMNISLSETVPTLRFLIGVARVFGIASTVLWLSGCVVAERRPRPAAVVVAPAGPPRETVVVREGPRGAEVIVREAPPAPRTEVVIVRPSARHVWIPGYWTWTEGRHVWVAGHWELPPRAHTAWIEPRWERRGEGYVFIEGHWR